MSAEENRKEKTVSRGVSLNMLNILMTCIGVLAAVLMIINNIRANRSYQLMDAEISESLLSQNATGKLETLSAAMTGSALAFAETGDTSHVYAYLGQMNTLAPDFSEGGMLSEQRLKEDPDLARAISAFNAMRTAELTAMRLKAETLPMPAAALPEQLQEVELPEEYAALSAEQKAEKASAMLNAPEYTALKSRLTGSVDASHRFVSERASVRTAEASRALKQVVERQSFLIALFIITAFIALAVNRELVLLPLIRSTDLLDRRERLPERGSSEMRHLARVYNDVLRDNEEKREALSYAASHDPLTGVLNRAAFDKAYAHHRKGRIGLLVVDVDLFKHFNDEYGHDVGDRVLTRVAEALKRSFRETDLICRIGGDEFCVIMTDADMDQAGRVRETVRKINRELSESTGDTPAITISVGAAFWNRKDPGPDIFKDADTALLQVKKHGKSSCEIYGAETEQ